MHRFWWIPNAISLCRALIAGPAVLTLYLWAFKGELGYPIDPNALPYRWIAFGIIVAAVLSDGIDGYLARRFAKYGWQTEDGQTWDPLADKIFGLCCIPPIYLHAFGGQVSLIHFALLAVLSVALAYVMYYSFVTALMRQRGLISAPNRDAKIKTFFLMGGKVCGFLAFALQGSEPMTIEAAPVATVLFSAGTVWVGVAAMASSAALEEYRSTAYRHVPH